ncbi:2-C-methyl-D-erythritol 2,4-cyclodiphosphate synthase [Pantoea sp. Aalb]|uniref:2-C-methyl-D-erythritol 2,4-cyclodiphosphate synthase n=1 Tax=Pantoea sp. Aalb TaxID=2576762 RepID=UPI0013239737|nr:2-C-methyl-D-erythritol 2,4-cyclodiphosphate synthase [Pantoea sp. Aalb]MXP67765.1 2-C-methyl-D-erythritol 2,4-cyclodiphosphate synthase [Pantoea sp. Aalb]
MRIGHGFDVHPFGGKGPLIIGGVHIPFRYSLVAHSDGDVVLHAITDALLSAAAMGDIGQLFPDTNPTFKGINSRILLCNAWKLIQQKRSYQIGNIDVTIIAQIPTMLPYLLQMRINLTEDLGCNIDDVNIKATTTERLGCIGRCEGIACETVVFLIKKSN